MTLPRTILIAGGLTAASSLGCLLDAAAPGDATHERTTVMLDDVASDERVCDPRVQIARRATASCDDLVGWNGEQLFDVGTPWLLYEDDNGPVAGALSRYCQYTWPSTELSEAQIDALYQAVGGDPIGPSCRAVTPQGDRLTDVLGPTLRDMFRFNTGRPSPSGLPLPVPGGLDPLVTVMVVDTQSDDLELEPTSRHGRHMGNIISDIACPEGHSGCRVEIDYVVGLPRRSGGLVDYERGGRVGTHADLAVAIYEGLRRWEEANANRAVPSRLVLNLSVGWEPDLFGGTEANPPPAIDAVRSALERARCMGAVIVASVGNAGDTCDPVGALLPAAWEEQPAPGATRCAELGVVNTPFPIGSDQPLVHAVGGLGLDLRPMPRARAEANPRLMAASAHAAAGDPVHGGLSGTSVGTAATTAAAALVWSYRPSLSPSAVMDWVYAGGQPLSDPISTDIALPGSNPLPPRRVDACAALAAACNDPGASCPPVHPTCVTSPAPQRSDLTAALVGVVPTAQLQRQLPKVAPNCVDVCGDPLEIHVGVGKVANCSALAVDFAEALVNPTPDSIGCPTCGIQNGTLLLSLHEDFDGIGIQNVLVTLVDEAGNTERYDLGPLPLSSTAYIRVALDPSKLPPGPIRAGEITIAFDDQKTVTTDPLLVL